MLAAAGIVLAGGRSSRMGSPKADLEWHGSTLLRRTVGVLARVVGGPLVVVRAPGQPLPPLPAGTEIVEDPREGLGPLQGIAHGLATVTERAEAAFVCATDMPFLHPAFIRRVLAALVDDADGADGVDVALPDALGHLQPLGAGYRTALAALAAELVEGQQLRPAYLFERSRVRVLDEAALLTDPALAGLDPLLDSLRGVNSPDEYAAARDRPAPEIVVRLAGAVASHRVRAATLAEAAAGVGLGWEAPLTASVDGAPATADPEFPLVTGDVVEFGQDRPSPDRPGPDLRAPRR